jgi:ClpP class serine protease
MASAAYWLGSAASEVVAAPESDTGSIGVWTAHVDASKMLEEIGWKVTLISAGKYKVEGNPYEPLAAEAREFIQSQVDEYYGMFIKAVARNRGDSQTAVREGYGQGRVLTAREAVKAKLVDRIGTLDQVVGELQAKYAKRKPTRRIRARGAGQSVSDTREQRLFKALVGLVMAVGSHPDAMRPRAAQRRLPARRERGAGARRDRPRRAAAHAAALLTESPSAAGAGKLAGPDGPGGARPSMSCPAHLFSPFKGVQQ